MNGHFIVPVCAVCEREVDVVKTDNGFIWDHVSNIHPDQLTLFDLES